MNITRLYHCVAAITLPLAGQILRSDYFPKTANRPSGLIVNVSGGVVVEPVKMWYWSADPANESADVNHDGFVTGDDADLFRAWFEAGDERADFDGDGFVTGEDFDEFQIIFENGSIAR